MLADDEQTEIARFNRLLELVECRERRAAVDAERLARHLQRADDEERWAMEKVVKAAAREAKLAARIAQKQARRAA